MSQTLSMLYVHLVFSTKDRHPYFRNEEIRKELYSYIGKVISNNDSFPIEIGGFDDHVHIFLDLSRNICLKDLVKWIKVGTSKWLKSKGNEFLNFHWQKGYGGFSVGQFHRSQTINYIRNQEEHHKKISFKDEFIQFLTVNNISYNEKYIWD